jgi:hypothetical protein
MFFPFEGVRLSEPADSIPPTKYASAQNVRSHGLLDLRVRPGYERISASRVVEPSPPFTGKSPYYATFAATTCADILAGVEAAAVACDWPSAPYSLPSVPAFSGSGLNDLSVSGTFTPAAGDWIYVRISGTSPDTFYWSYEYGATSASIPITGAAQALNGVPAPSGNGLSVTFGSPSGHTIGDSWIFYVGPVGKRYTLTTPQGLSYYLVVQDHGESGGESGDGHGVTFQCSSLDGSVTSIPHIVCLNSTLGLWANQCKMSIAPPGLPSGVSQFACSGLYAYDTSDPGDPTTELWYSTSRQVSTPGNAQDSLRDSRVAFYFTCCRNGVGFSASSDTTGALQIFSPSVLTYSPSGLSEQIWNGQAGGDPLTLPVYVGWGSNDGQVLGHSPCCLRGVEYDAALRTVDAGGWDVSLAFAVGSSPLLNWISFFHSADSSSYSAETNSFLGSTYLLAPFSGPAALIVSESQSVPIDPHVATAQIQIEDIFKITNLPDPITGASRGAIDIMRDTFIAAGWLWLDTSMAVSVFHPFYWSVIFTLIGTGSNIPSTVNYATDLWLDDDGLPYPILLYDPSETTNPYVDIGPPTGVFFESVAGTWGGGGWFGPNNSLSGRVGNVYTGAWAAKGATSLDTAKNVAAAVQLHTHWNAVASADSSGRPIITLTHKPGGAFPANDPTAANQNVWQGFYTNSWTVDGSDHPLNGGYWLKMPPVPGSSATVGCWIWLRPTVFPIETGDTLPPQEPPVFGQAILQIQIQVFVDDIDFLELPYLSWSQNQASIAPDSAPVRLIVHDYDFAIYREGQGDEGKDSDGTSSGAWSLLLTTPYVDPAKIKLLRFELFAVDSVRDALAWYGDGSFMSRTPRGMIALNAPHPDRISWNDLNLCPLSEANLAFVPGLMGLRYDSRVTGGRAFNLTTNQGLAIVQEARIAAPACPDPDQGKPGHEVTGNSAHGQNAGIIGKVRNAYISTLPTTNYVAVAQIDGRVVRRVGSQPSAQSQPSSSLWVVTGETPTPDIPALGVSIDALQPGTTLVLG